MRSLATSPLPLLLVLSAAVWIHFAALRAPFLTDDYLFLDYVRHRGLGADLFLHDAIGNYFRPLSRSLHFWVWARAGAESPAVFHAVNLALFLGSIALLYRLVQRLAGARSAAIAASGLALHAAADVPVYWASGAQDLLAVTLALAALTAQQSRRPAWAAALFALALLSKEIVAGLPLIAVAFGRPPGESLRAGFARTRWLWLVLAAWLVLWLSMSPPRTAADSAVRVSLAGPIAALAHLAQAVFPAAVAGEAIQWPRVGRDAVAIGLVLCAVLLAGAAAGGRKIPPARSEPSAHGNAARSLVVAGAIWAIAGALPIAPVVHQWSLYFYLFAVCGVALVAAGVLSRVPSAIALAAIAALGFLSSAERRAEGFATADDPWATRSHVRLFYLERAAIVVDRYHRDLLRARPTVPGGSTFFFSGIPAYVGWQAADGPLVRWAYRDSSLRSYFVNAMDERSLSRGPAFFFRSHEGGLVEETDQPGMWRGLALRLLLARRDDMAARVLERAEEREPEDGAAWYLDGWVHLARADTAGARERFARAGVSLRGDPKPELAEAERALAAGDSSAGFAALTHAIAASALDPTAHARLAELLVGANSPTDFSIPEGYACLVLEPERPATWYRWAVLQLDANRVEAAEEALARHDSLSRTRVPHPGAAAARRRLAGLQPGGAERERMR